jgi:hypothetical protein
MNKKEEKIGEKDRKYKEVVESIESIDNRYKELMEIEKISKKRLLDEM